MLALNVNSRMKTTNHYEINPNNMERGDCFAKNARNDISLKLLHPVMVARVCNETPYPLVAPMPNSRLEVLFIQEQFTDTLGGATENIQHAQSIGKVIEAV
jgi:hypothetical protein